jgi:hypothetical protein
VMNLVVTMEQWPNIDSAMTSKDSPAASTMDLYYMSGPLMWGE